MAALAARQPVPVVSSIGGQMVQLTRRDEAMILWLDTVRMADLEAVRYALAGLAGANAESRHRQRAGTGAPVSLRKAQQWVARMRETGLVDSGRPTFREGSIVWATHAATGKPAPHLFRQTTRHEVAVATVSARMLAHGWGWGRDRVPASKIEHMADGYVSRLDVDELVEVELTPKVVGRYVHIFNNHVQRLEREGVARVLYFCDPTTERAVRRVADLRVHPSNRHRVVTIAAFDERGRWIGDDARVWADGRAVDPTMTTEPAVLTGFAERNE